MEIKENVPLSSLNTFKIGGSARYFSSISNVDQLKEAVSFAEEKKLPFFILGEGSNTLISDRGFPGLVIHIAIKGVEWTESGIPGQTTVIAGAGEHWDDLVRESVARGLYGLENLSGIPGSVGAAPVQNIGAYGVEMESVFLWAEAFDTVTREVKKMHKADSQFSYRDSIFKKPEGKRFIIVRAAFVLNKRGALKTEYKDVKEYFEMKGVLAPTLSDVRDVVLHIRRNKLPDINKLGTAGSFFKNPIVLIEKYNALKKQFPEMPSYPVDDTHVKIPLAWVLDKLCNLKGMTFENIGTYKNQPLVLVNFGGGTSAQVKTLAKKIQDAVKEKIGVDIEYEVRFLGEV
jgi:UDP-N-acetylmuramate dehydrogenase